MKPAALLVLVLTGGLAGCGVKGALYLPEKPSEVVIRPAPGTGPTAEKPAPEPPPADDPGPPRDD